VTLRSVSVPELVNAILGIEEAQKSFVNQMKDAEDV
jgi:hypothetical protein